MSKSNFEIKLFADGANTGEIETDSGEVQMTDQVLIKKIGCAEIRLHDNNEFSWKRTLIITSIIIITSILITQLCTIIKQSDILATSLLFATLLFIFLTVSILSGVFYINTPGYRASTNADG